MGRPRDAARRDAPDNDRRGVARLPERWPPRQHGEGDEQSRQRTRHGQEPLQHGGATERRRAGPPGWRCWRSWCRCSRCGASLIRERSRAGRPGVACQQSWCSIRFWHDPRLYTVLALLPSVAGWRPPRKSSLHQVRRCCREAIQLACAGGARESPSGSSGQDAITRNTEDLAASMQLVAYWEPTGGQGDIDTGLCTPREARRRLKDSADRSSALLQLIVGTS